MFIDDITHSLSPADLTSIQAARSALDVKIVVTSSDSRSALDARVSSMVNSANTLAIGVDPVHRYTFTHFGVGTGINPSDFQLVAKAGNGEFKQGRWADGMQAIIASANSVSTRSGSKATIVQSTTVVERPVSAWPFVAGAAAFIVAIFLLVRWLQRKEEKAATVLRDFRSEADQMRSRNIEEQPWHDKFKAKETTAAAPLRSPSSRREVHHHHHGSGGDNLALGVMIGQASAPRPVVVVESPRYSAPEPTHSSSSSSWGSDSSSSYDSGSSGGGFDSGGGGFDGGGGGGDF